MPAPHLMTVHFNLFNIVLLFGTLQGIILSLVLLFSRSDKRQNKFFLAAFMLVLAYNSFGTFCWSSGFYMAWLGFFDSLLPYTFIFSVGSSFYLYIKTTIEPVTLPGKTIVKIYLPGIIDLLFRLCLLVYAVLNKNGVLTSVDAGKIDAFYQPIAMVLMVIVFWYFLVKAIRLLKNNQKQTTGSQPSPQQAIATRWTRALLIVMTLIAAVWALTIFSSVLFNISGLAFFAPIEIILVIFVYWIGLRGYQQTKVVFVNEQKAAKTYMDSIDPEEAEKCVCLLQNAMENDKLYLDPELTVNKVAEHIAISPKLISAVLNGQLKKGFSAFVNEYRVAEVKEKMLHPANSHITLAGLAMDSGFNSVATFQRVFKAAEQMSPKEFLARNQQTTLK